MKKVLVVISDENYLDHAGSLFVNALIEGKWDGDLCLIANNIDNQNEKLKFFTKMGVKILHRSSENPYIINLYIFEEFFKSWDYMIYMDCDFMIFKKFDDFFKNIDTEYDGIIADIEPFKIHEYLCQGWEEEEKNENLKNIRKKYDIDKFGFNAGFLAFNTKIIDDKTLNELFNINEEIKHINNHTHPTGSDQPIFNLFFNQKVDYIKNNNVCFWKNINTNTFASHFCRWEAPWVNNNFSDVFGKTYLEKYKENKKIFYSN